MGLRLLHCVSPLAIFLILTSAGAAVQDMNSLKPGVVRIQNNRSNEAGTGFIVKVDGNQVYILTAAHVVKGDQHPRIYLFNQQRDPLQAELLDREDDDLKGLALLRLKVPARIASGITALKLSSTTQLGGGEDVKVIGFPDGTAFWTVSNGSIARIEGRNLVFSGAIRGGNSGGPVIFNGLVIGMVTDVSQATAYAARGEIILPYVNGIVPNLINLDASTNVRSDNSASNNSASKDTFCQVLTQLIEASKKGFRSLVGKPSPGGSAFVSTLDLPGTSVGYIYPDQRAFYYILVSQDKQKVQDEYGATVSKLLRCLQSWKQWEEKDSSNKYHNFNKSKIEPTVKVAYNFEPQHKEKYYYLSLEVIFYSK